MAARLTWEEIKREYPDQWLGLTDVIWENRSNIESAIVKYAGLTKNEALELALDSKGQIIPRSTKRQGLRIDVNCNDSAVDSISGLLEGKISDDTDRHSIREERMSWNETDD